MALSDLTGEGESKLVLADLGSGNFNMKLLVFKGTQLVSGHVIWLTLKSILFWRLPWRKKLINIDPTPRLQVGNAMT